MSGSILHWFCIDSSMGSARNADRAEKGRPLPADRKGRHFSPSGGVNSLVRAFQVLLLLLDLRSLREETDFLSGLPFLDLLYTGRTVFHTVANNEQGRLDLIAYKYPKDTSLAYFIALYNNIIDPLSEVTTGRDLAIPIDAIPTGEIKPFTYTGT